MQKLTWRLIATASLTAPLLLACNTRDDRAMSDSAAGAFATGDTAYGVGSMNEMSAGAMDASIAEFMAVVNQSEVEAGRLAMTKARNTDVRNFARKMVEEHERAMNDMNDLGTRNGWNTRPGTAGMGTAGGMGAAGMGTGATGRTGTAAGTGTGARTGTGTAGGTGMGTGTAMGATGSGNSAGATTGSTARGTTPGTARSGEAGREGTMSGTGSAGQGGGAAASLNNVMMQLHQQHETAMQTLRTTSGAAFDRAYMDTQVTAHQQVLDMLRQHETSVQNTELRDRVTSMRGDVENHLREAQEIAQRVGSAQGQR
jgi:predicted outer membrane protein